ncbi:expressed unknown protein [Seminavis robusta]|uniref:Uncharacterized protein n=1 Tax=Seminavis robusta TaxID=568900 RepID=A0A9N8DPS4_9STRA|nr:expressed unknown protein [Seminavis robusta]|eukprot:Sro283_g107790.1 n/a (372) ;mRNA; f:57654-58769
MESTSKSGEGKDKAQPSSTVAGSGTTGTSPNSLKSPTATEPPLQATGIGKKVSAATRSGGTIGAVEAERKKLRALQQETHVDKAMDPLELAKMIERNKLLAWEQEAPKTSALDSNLGRAMPKAPSTGSSSNLLAPQNVEEAMDPLELAKMVETRLQQGWSPNEQDDSLLHPTMNPRLVLEDVADGNIDPLHLEKIVQTRLQHPNNNIQPPNTTTTTSTMMTPSIPGAYSGAPGTDLQRTDDLRFSLVGASSGKDFKDSVVHHSVTASGDHHHHHHHPSVTASMLRKSTTDTAVTLQATLVTDQDNAESLRMELEQIKASPIAEVVGMTSNETDTTIMTASGKRSFMIGVAIFVAMVVGTLIVVILWPIVFM